MSFINLPDGTKEYFDYCYYIRTYKDLKSIKTLKQAIDHYNKYGKKENRKCNNLSKLASHILSKISLNDYADIGIKNLLILIELLPNYAFLEKENLKKMSGVVRFVYGDYIKMYPDYKTIFGKNFRDCEINFWQHARSQRLLPNLKIATLMEMYQRYTLDQYLQSLKGDINGDYITEDRHNFLIITRTHNRKQLFDECHKNIMAQARPNINIKHVVSFDNTETEEYVRLYSDVTPCSLIKNNDLHPNAYFDIIVKYLDTQGHLLNNSHIIFLDDDDAFTHNGVLEDISKYLTGSELIIWKFYRNDKYIEIPKERIKNPIVGDIATCSYCFNSSVYEYGKWKPSSIGDFDFFKFLYEKIPDTNKIFIDVPLTKVNYAGKISGWSAQ